MRNALWQTNHQLFSSRERLALVIESTGHEPAARGIYIDLFAFAWQSQPFATLPNDPAQLHRLVGADSAEWADLWPQISGSFEVEDGHLVNRRLQDEARKRDEFIRRQQANGAKGWRPSKNQGVSSGLPESARSTMLFSSVLTPAFPQAIHSPAQLE